MEILVAQKRISQNITQKELAEYAGINQQKLSRIERGSEPYVSVALKISRGLNTTVEEIFVL